MGKKRVFTEILKEEYGTNGIRLVTIKVLYSEKIEVYKVFNDIWYTKDTQDSLIFVLDRLHRSKSRFRLHYGDVNTGDVWLDEHDIMGTMGVSTGEIRIPLLIRTRRSTGGVSILSDCILKITEIHSKQVLWEHPNYKIPVFEIKQRGEEGFPSNLPDEYTTAVFYKGKNQANFKDPSYAEAYVAFMRGEQNVLRPLKRAI